MADRELTRELGAASDSKGLSYISGLAVTNAADTDHDITVAAGSIMDSTNTVLLTLGSAMTKRIDAAWAAGTGNGGYASASGIAADTPYRFFALKLSDGSIDLGWDVSETAVTLLAASGATHYRRLDWSVTDSSSNIKNHVLEGPTTRTWVTGSTEFSGAPTVAGALVSTVTPPNQVGVFLNSLHTGSTDLSSVLVNSVAIPTLAPALNNGMIQVDSSGAENAYTYEKKLIQVNSSRQVRQRSDNTSANLRLVSLGWNNNIEVA